MCPNSRDGIESADPWGMITDEMEEAIAKKKKDKKKGGGRKWTRH